VPSPKNPTAIGANFAVGGGKLSRRPAWTQQLLRCVDHRYPLIDAGQAQQLGDLVLACYQPESPTALLGALMSLDYHLQPG
jgi:hypothetical protein